MAASAPRTRMIMFTANHCEGLAREAQDVASVKSLQSQATTVARRLLAAIRRDVFHDCDAA